MGPMGLITAAPVGRTGFRRSAGNPILSPAITWEGAALEEPSVIYESSTWKMWYTGGWLSSAMGYATCTSDPTVAANWTKYASNPVLGQGGSSVSGYVSGNNVTKIGSTYYAYYYDTDGGGNLKVSTSSDGISWGTPTTAIASNAVAWMTGWANSYAWNEGGSTWKMLVEGRSTTSGSPWRIAYATSTDGLSWTIVGSGPLTSLILNGGTQCGGPWLLNGGQKINGLYHLVYHAGTGNFTDIYRAYSSDAQNWTIVPNWILQHNGGTYETEQAADPSMIEVNALSYLFYDGVDNAGPHGYLNVATYPSTIANLVLWGN